MAGALSVLGVGAALLNLEGRIVACDQRFAEAAGQPIAELIGRNASELAHPCDRTRDPWLAQQALRSGQSYTTLTRRADHVGLYENHVIQLLGADAPLILAISRPCKCREAREPAALGMAEAVAGYSADMAKQMAHMAARAQMPVTVDLFMAAASAAEMEGGVGEVAELQA